MKRWMQMRRAVLWYLGLALVIFLPLLGLGYVQTLDMPWGPRIVSTGVGDNVWLLYQVLKVLSWVLSSMVVQKVLLVGIFVLAGCGAHRLMRTANAGAAAYVAGIFYMCNPFVYTRLMAGQWLVLLGYALLPWALDSIWQLQQRPGFKRAVVALVWLVAVGLTSIHAVGFVVVAAVVLLAVQGRAQLGQRLLWTAPLALVPLLVSRANTVLLVQGFGDSQMHAFATTGSVLGSVPLSTLLLQGFWADPQRRYYLPSHLGWWWGVVAVLLACLIIIGVITAWQRRDRLALGLGLLALLGWWLAMGIGSQWSAGTTQFLVHHLPLYRGYREPQKWLMLLAVAYAYFAALGVSRVKSLLYGGLLLPLLLTPVLLWGAAGQLVSARYPAGWQQTAATLNADQGDYQVLVLPWHLYLPLSFTKRIVANPAGHYFKQPVIISDNPELPGVPPQQSSALYRQIDNVLLPQRLVRTDAAQQLAPYKVKYVLLLHEADWQRYGWLNQQTGLQPLSTTASTSLYRNTEVQ